MTDTDTAPVLHGKAHGTTLFMTKGLPASGKSTWSEEQAKNRLTKVVRVNKDLLRDMLHAGVWKGRQTENQILEARDLLIQHFLENQVDVICDDTNLAPEHETRLRALADYLNVDFVVADFTHVDKKLCIKRDLKRTRSVGHKVIQQMWLKYLAPKWEPPVFDPAKQPAIIVDIDGTVAHMQGRSPYDYSKVSTDVVDPVVRQLVRDAKAQGATVLIVSGRKDECYEATDNWLVDHQIPADFLYMRATGDERDDAIVKSEIYERHIAPHYNVLFVLDDRDRVVDMWRARGLKTLQVEPGDF